QLSPAGAPPPPRSGHVAVWDAANSQMMVFGGIASDQTAFGDTWAYRPASNAWVQLGMPTAPPARSYAAAAWDTANNQMLLFGGAVRGGDPYPWLPLSSSVLAAYRPATDSWVQLPAPGRVPLGRYGAAAAWDPGGRQLLVVGGTYSDGDYHVSPQPD